MALVNNVTYSSMYCHKHKLQSTLNLGHNKIEGTPILNLAMQWLKDYGSEKLAKKMAKNRQKNSAKNSSKCSLKKTLKKTRQKKTIGIENNSNTKELAVFELLDAQEKQDRSNSDPKALNG